MRTSYADTMSSTQIMFLDSYNTCKITGDVCRDGDCRTCCIPLLYPEKAKDTLGVW